MHATSIWTLIRGKTKLPEDFLVAMEMIKQAEERGVEKQDLKRMIQETTQTYIQNRISTEVLLNSKQAEEKSIQT